MDYSRAIYIRCQCIKCGFLLHWRPACTHARNMEFDKGSERALEFLITLYRLRCAYVICTETSWVDVILHNSKRTVHCWSTTLTIRVSINLTHISLAFFFVGHRQKVSADPGQTPRSAASDQGIHYLLIECSIKI